MDPIDIIKWAGAALAVISTLGAGVFVWTTATANKAKMDIFGQKMEFEDARRIVKSAIADQVASQIEDLTSVVASPGTTIVLSDGMLPRGTTSSQVQSAVTILQRRAELHPPYAQDPPPEPER